MFHCLSKKAITSTLTMLFIALFLFSAKTISANELPTEKEKVLAAETSSKEKTDNKENSEKSEGGQATISYILFANAMKVEPASEIRPRYATEEKAASPLIIISGQQQQLPSPMRDTVASAPLTSGEKFKFFVRGSFLSRGPYIQPLFSGSIQELFDNDEGKKDTVGNYVADTLSRAARSYAFGTTARFIQDFALASAFRQDPRYHRVPRRSTGARIMYAVSRVFVTRGDNGNDQINASFLLGGAMTAAISNVWEREENKTWGRSLRRWGFNIGFSALGNIGAEFLGGQ